MNVLSSLAANLGFAEDFRFKVNEDKTEALLLGPASYDTIPASGRPFVRDKIKLLGVVLSTDHSKVLDENYNPIVEKIHATLSRWRNRNLSLAGKI